MEGQVLIKVASAMCTSDMILPLYSCLLPLVLPHDQKARDMGLFIGDKLPFILGANVAGTVEQVGGKVTSLAVGDAIFGLSNFLSPTPDQSGLQQYAILDVDAAAKIPQGFSADEVASLPINLVTSWIALFDGQGAGLGFPAPFSLASPAYNYSSETLVVLAAGSSVGKFAIQLAALVGIGRIIAVAGPSGKDELLDMGATHFVDRHLAPDQLVKRVHALTGAEGVTHLYHCHGRDWSVDTALLAREKPSHLRSVHRMTSEQSEQLRRERPLSDSKFLQCSGEGLAPYARDFWESVPRWLIERKVRPGAFRVIEGLERVDEIDAALDDHRGGGGAVQIVVHP